MSTNRAVAGVAPRPRIEVAPPSEASVKLWLIVGAACGLSIGVAAGTAWGTSAPFAWWATRAFGMLAYVALWLSMLFGLLLSSRHTGRLSVPVISELHNQWSLAALVATGLHVAAAVSEPQWGVPLASVAIPFTSSNLTGPVALGTFALWGMAAVAVTTWLRSRLSYGTWRAVHGLAFGAFLIALLHAVTAGTDTRYLLVQWAYVLTGGAMVGAVAYRALSAVTRPRRRARPAR